MLAGLGADHVGEAVLEGLERSDQSGGPVPEVVMRIEDRKRGQKCGFRHLGPILAELDR